MEGGQQTGTTKARRYVRIPEECISLCAENLGIQTSREVTGALVEDVSFRIRQVTQLAIEFVKHSNRKRVCKEDFDKALKWSGIEPVHGHSGEPPPFMYIHENGLFSVEDQEVLLQDLSLSCPVAPSNLPPPPSLSARWLMVEGVAIDTEGSPDDLPTSVHLQKPPVEAHQKYLSLLMEGITGDSEELRRIALTDLQTNAAVASILPDLIHYLLETLSCWVQFGPVQLMRVLKMVHSLFINKHLFLDPYGVGLFPLVKSILVTPSYLASDSVSDHWSVRRASAMCLAEITARCATPLNEYIPDINTSFRQLLWQSDITLQVLYGVVLSLCQLGGKTLSEVLFPRLDVICQTVQRLSRSRDLTVRDSSLRVHEALLLSAEILLMSGVSVEVRPEHISSPSSSSSPSHLRTFSTLFPAGGGGGGAHDNSFLSSFGPTGGKSLMDTSDLNLGGGPQQDMPSLYEFLVDVFGESLVLRLTCHPKNVVQLGDKKMPGVSVKTGAPGRRGSIVGMEGRGRAGAEERILAFLKREGFRPFKVQLPMKPLSRKPPAYHPWGRQLWQFQISTVLLPVQRNALDERGRPYNPRRNLTNNAAAVRTGKHRRRNWTLLRAHDLCAFWL